MPSFNFIVGTFNTPELYTLAFTPPSSQSSASDGQQKPGLKILKRHTAIGSHSWLSLSSSKRNLYATCWTEPPTIAAYAINSPSEIDLLNAAPTKSRSGYVCCSETHVYSAGGASGEVFAIDQTSGALTSTPTSSVASESETQTNGDSHRDDTNKQSPSKPTAHANGISTAIRPVQKLNFVSDLPQQDNGSTMDFGGLRHGAHSADLSPDGKILYIADIGRNCIWTYAVNHNSSQRHEPQQKQTSTTTDTNENLTLIEKYISPRSHDGPRHAHPHPNGQVVYVLQEHSSMVDVFRVDSQTNKFAHVQGVRIIPHGLPVSDFWADEVRTSLSSTSDKSSGKSPEYLYASTRGLKNGRKGYVAVYKLLPSGLIDGAEQVRQPSSSTPLSSKVDDQDMGGLLCMYETATSGGWANAIEPGPTVDGVEYLALTDSEVGYVFVLAWNGSDLCEVARVNLTQASKTSSDGTTAEQVTVVGAATAVWL